MIFHENRLLADDSHEILYTFFRKIRKMSQKLSSAAVVIYALRVNLQIFCPGNIVHLLRLHFRLDLIMEANTINLDKSVPDRAV